MSDNKKLLAVTEHRTKRLRLTRSTSGMLSAVSASATSEDSSSSSSSKQNVNRQACSTPSAYDGPQPQITPTAASDPIPPQKTPSMPSVQNSLQENASAISTTSTSRLPELLDLTSVTSLADIHYRFGQISRSILNEHVLVLEVGNTHAQNSRAEYELLEIEFYLRKDGHEDPFAHGTEEQKVSGNWYFHRAPRRSADPTRSATSSSGYRGGSRKGVDLTFGGPISSPCFSQQNAAANRNKVDNAGTRGGILFRSMRRLSDSAIISGPSLLVDELLRVSGTTSIAGLVEDALAGDRSAFSSITPTASKKSCSISLRPRKTVPGRKPTVYSSPRIGLDLAHPGTTALPADPRVVFVQKAYRYFVHPNLLTANGRVQTFLGLYNLISDAEIMGETGVLDEVARLSGLKSGSVEKYAKDFREGKREGKVGSFVGAPGKGAAASPSTYLRMMGTLAQLSTS